MAVRVGAWSEVFHNGIVDQEDLKRLLEGGELTKEELLAHATAEIKTNMVIQVTQTQGGIEGFSNVERFTSFCDELVRR